jgi:acetoin utilization protein AcuC
MPPGANDEAFYKVWAIAESFIGRFRPEFIILQAGADSLSGDPITHLDYSSAAHTHATRSLMRLAAEYDCPLLALGGGGYNHDNIASGWTVVVRGLIGGSV